MGGIDLNHIPGWTAHATKSRRTYSPAKEDGSQPLLGWALMGLSGCITFCAIYAICAAIWRMG